MTASAIQKRFSQMSVSHKKVPVEETEESNSEFIKSINYDSLEKKYDIHKYYPSYIHNCGISTPVLRDLIIDKPIYADANKHVKKKKKRSSARDGRSTRRLEQVQELRELKKDQLQDRKDLRKEMRDLKKSQKTEVQEIKRKYKGRISQNIQEIKHNNKLMNDGSKEPNGRKISSVRNNSVGNVNPYEIGTSFSNFVDTSDETEVDEEDFLDLGYSNKEGLEGHFGMFEETKFRDPFNTFTIEKVSSAMNTLNNSNSNSNSMNSTIYLNNTNNNGHHYHNSVSHSTAASALSGSTKRNSSITGKFMKMMKGGSISSESSNDDGLISRNNTNIPFTHVLSKNSTNNSNNLSKNNSNTNGSHDHKNSYGGRNPGEPPLNPLSKAQSYDQTRSHMTNKRQNIKEKFLKLKINGERRHSDQIEVVTENVNNGHTGEIETIQYTQSQMVGHGSFGVVFQTQILPSNEIAAMKRVLQDKRFKNRELQIMKLVHHRNIADLKYYFYTSNDKNELYLNLILEFVPETLYKASHFYVSKRLSMPAIEIKLYTYQMLRALNYIHSQGICHRDIKPQNLLINPETGELKLCDFGSAKILNPNEPNVSYICSRYYRAPELIFGATNYTTKIDVWSAGCVMAELILGQPLFPGESGIDQLVEIIKILGTPSKDQIKNMNPNYMEHKFPQIKPIPLSKIFKKMSNDCIQFLIKVLQYSPVDRISCVEALVDPYFDELRNPQTKLPNYRKIFSQQFHLNSSSSHHSINNANYQIYSSQPDFRELPELFDFNDRELSSSPDLNFKLVPPFAYDRLNLKQQISSLDQFVPWTAEELKVTLE